MFKAHKEPRNTECTGRVETKVEHSYIEATYTIIRVHIQNI